MLQVILVHQERVDHVRHQEYLERRVVGDGGAVERGW